VANLGIFEPKPFEKMCVSIPACNGKSEAARFLFPAIGLKLSSHGALRFNMPSRP
jgi:hypothetical protein